MKTSISAGIALTAFVGMAADQTLNSVCDLGTFTPTTTQWLYFNSNTTNEAFTLSRDADFGTLDFNANSGSVFFDFSDGNHTIKVKSFRAANRKAPWVILKGGTWNLGTGSAHDFRCYYNTEVGGRTILLDSCTVTNVDWMHGFQGTNNTLILQNGSCMYANNYRLTYPGAVATTQWLHGRKDAFSHVCFRRERPQDGWRRRFFCVGIFVFRQCRPHRRRVAAGSAEWCYDREGRQCEAQRNDGVRKFCRDKHQRSDNRRCRWCKSQQDGVR